MKQIEKPVILPRGSNPINKISVKRPLTTKEAKDAMNECFKTYVHPGVLQRATQTEE